MNTSKQVNVMIGLMFVTLVGVLLYFIWDDVRAEDAKGKQTVENAERGGKLFSLNCRSCHGMNGLGPLENVNLLGLPLNQEINRPDGLGELMTRQSRILDTIRCGRVGTLMPAWAEDQGGPLNDFQIQQLVALITGAMPGLDVPDNPNAVSEKGWEAAVEEADHADLQGFEDKQLAEAVGLTDTIFVLTETVDLMEDSLLRIDDEVVKIVTVAADSDEITVERAAFATEAAAHEEGAQLFTGPIEPPTGPLTGENGDPPCGQLAAAPSGPSGEPIPIEGEVTMEMGDNFFQLDGQQSPILEVSVGQDVTINLVNNGLAIHNMHIAGVDNTYDVVFCEVGGDETCSDPALMAGGDTGTIEFRFDDAGTFDFRCDFHPVLMTGQIVVVE
jgi:plastocyanin/mono/diheme cytochrome c family protein